MFAGKLSGRARTVMRANAEISASLRERRNSLERRHPRFFFLSTDNQLGYRGVSKHAILSKYAKNNSATELCAQRPRAPPAQNDKLGYFKVHSPDRFCRIS